MNHTNRDVESPFCTRTRLQAIALGRKAAISPARRLRRSDEADAERAADGIAGDTARPTMARSPSIRCAKRAPPVGGNGHRNDRDIDSE